MQGTPQLPGRVELRHLAERQMVERRKPDQVYRPQPVLQRPASASGRLFGRVEPDDIKAEHRQHVAALLLRSNL